MDAVATLIAGGAAAALLAGGGMYAGNWPTSQIFGATEIASSDPSEVFLTYDDGPHPEFTPALLDALAVQNVKATFFMMGEHVRRHPALARRVAEAGHTIGNHTQTHPSLIWCGANETRRELESCQREIFDATGVQARVFRPPFGARNPATLRVAREMGLTPVMWNVTAKDWKPLGVDGILELIDSKMRRNAARGVASTILLHDSSHLEGSGGSRVDTIKVTRRLLQREGLRFMQW